MVRYHVLKIFWYTTFCINTFKKSKLGVEFWIVEVQKRRPKRPKSKFEELGFMLSEFDTQIYVSVSRIMKCFFSLCYFICFMFQLVLALAVAAVVAENAVERPKKQVYPGYFGYGSNYGEDFKINIKYYKIKLKKIQFRS